MTSARPTPRVVSAVEEAADDEADETLEGEGQELPEIEAADDLSEETGIDLTDASELDADNVPADEESDRVLQAPD